ncbi:MAG TPA: hypothetical protein VFR29_11185 [Steroidobacteraceae bacterium]|nr:hypothetical protein [Steroidobacteraceae bacterium]
MFQAPMRSLVLLATMVLANPAWAQQGALAVPRNLEQLTDRAATIVRGSVVRAHVEMHPELGSLHTVVVTLRVRETLKGPARREFTFRQYVWDLRSRVGETFYRKGDDLILFMIEPSRYGLSSPAGMGQGRFVITRDAAGREIAVNGAGNARLFDGMREALARKEAAYSADSARLVSSHRQGPVEAALLTRLIRETVDARR